MALRIGVRCGAASDEKEAKVAAAGHGCSRGMVFEEAMMAPAEMDGLDQE